MKMCQRHWDLLKDAIKERGLYDLVAPDGKAAMTNMASEVQSGSKVTNFDPLMAAHNDIWGHAMDLAGLAVMSPNPDGSEKCPICYCADLHAPECKDDPCPDPRFDEWIGFAANHAKIAYEALLKESEPQA